MPQMLMRQFLRNPTPFHQRVRTVLASICEQGQGGGPEPRGLYLESHFYCASKHIDPFLLSHFELTTQRREDSVASTSRLGNQDFQSNLCSLQHVFWQVGWNPQFSYDIVTLDL